MRVILLEDVPKLGKQGDVVEVSDGYARNFLLPRNLVAEASEARLRELKEKNEKAARRKEKEEEKAKGTKATIDGQTVVVKAKCGEGGKLFGAVTSKEITDALKRQYKVEVDRKRVEIKDPIRHLGDYPVRIRLHQQALAEINVKVEEA